MATVYFVRHGQAAAGFAEHLDPGLGSLGRSQAEAVATRLEGAGPLPIVSSPLARARETAEPLARRWGILPQVEPRISELPSGSRDLDERARWIAEVLAQRWSGLDPVLRGWRDALLRFVSGIKSDCVAFSHFIAINAVVGAASKDDRVVVFRPDHASVTTVAIRSGAIEVVELGDEAETQVG